MATGEKEGKALQMQNEVKDNYNLAYIIHFMLGMGNLLPWNALITAVDYFAYMYPEKHVDKVFSVAYMSSSLPVFVGLISWSRRMSVRLRMNLGLSMFVFMLLIVPIIDWVYINYDTKRLIKGYGVTVFAVVVCGLADGLVGGSLVGSVGELPQRYMQAVFAGTASSGVLVCILRLITKALLPRTRQGLRKSAHIYFIVSTLILLICIVCYNILDKLPVMKYHKGKITQTSRSFNNLSEDPTTRSTRALCTNHQPSLQPRFWDVWKRIKWLAFGVLAIYVITLSIFPGYISENISSKSLGDWYPILLITIYNISDLIGKSLTAIYVLKNPRKATFACVTRLVFYPLFAACQHGPKFFQTEIFVVLLTGALGLTNGYLTSVLMILAPKSVPIVEAETAGILMTLFLGIGLAGGSILGWFWII